MTTTYNSLAYSAATCQGCGVSDDTVRFAVFQYVISMIVATSRRTHYGFYCEACRSKRGLRFRLTTLALGWWGFPWGIPHTIQALGTPMRGVVSESTALRQARFEERPPTSRRWLRLSTGTAEAKSLRLGAIAVTVAMVLCAAWLALTQTAVVVNVTDLPDQARAAGRGAAAVISSVAAELVPAAVAAAPSLEEAAPARSVQAAPAAAPIQAEVPVLALLAPSPEATVSLQANLRAGPGTSFARVGGVAKGARLQVLGSVKGTDGAWWYCLASNRWIRADLVTGDLKPESIAGGCAAR
jgi:hypothetical protein